MLKGITLKALLWAFFISASSFSYAEQAKHGSFVATAHPSATEIGLQVLKDGGNVFDASVAITAALAVAEPYSSGIGGGGFYLFYIKAQDRFVFIDAREKAPMAAHADLFYNEKTGQYDRNYSLNSVLGAGIPGIPAALDHINKSYGKLPLSQLLIPAVELAENGVEVDKKYLQLLSFRSNQLANDKAANDIFYQDGKLAELGAKIYQPDLATTLKLLAFRGRDGFYTGAIGNKLVNAVKQRGGVWTHEDLENYHVVERTPVRFKFYDWEVISAPPPSAGGLALAQMLPMLETKNIKSLLSHERTHVAAEAMRRAYRDRAEYLGDPDFVDIPMQQLISKKYVDEYAKSLDVLRATKSSELRPAIPSVNDTEDTTHFSVVDAEGNYASATLSINYPFGTGIVADGTGVLLNNELDDFSTHPGVPNAYGLVASTANGIEGGKRPLSSMTPTIVKTPTGDAILGTPGGSRIITMVFIAILEMLESKDPKKWVSAPRFHHQYLPDVVQYESTGIEEDLVSYWQQLGHHTDQMSRQYGNMQAIWLSKDGSVLTGASDPRGVGVAAGSK